MKTKQEICVGSALFFREAKRRLQATTQLKVRDMDVGALAGFASSETTHWKKGNYPIRDIVRIKGVCAAIGLSLDTAAAIISGDMIPDGMESEAKLLTERTK